MPLSTAARWTWAVAGVLSPLGGTPASACAQPAPEPATPFHVGASLDLGAAKVEYDEFLPSSLVSVSTLVRVDAPNAVVAFRGSAARYEGTGNLNVQGALVGSAFTPAWHAVRAELGGALASGRHETVGGSSTAQLFTRLHLGTSPTMGLWLGGGVGWSSFGAGFGAGVRQGDVGGWLREGPWRVSVAFQPAFLDGDRYGDVLGTVRWSRGRVELGAEAGVRAGSVSIGVPDPTRRWASADALVWLGRRLAVVGALGRTPSDPVAGTGGGRYATLALRVASRPTEAEEPPRVLLPRVARPSTTPALVPSGADSTDDDDGAAPLRATVVEDLEVAELDEGRLRLRFELAPARSAEVMGDFSDWEPRPLRRLRDGSWELVVELPPGVHRMNLRTDGGEWRVPPKLTAVDDGFGGRVGLLVVRR